MCLLENFFTFKKKKTFIQNNKLVTKPHLINISV